MGCIRDQDGYTPFEEVAADIIDRETHAPEIIEFIERVASWDFEDANHWRTHGGEIAAAQKQAFELLKKVRA